MDNNKLISVRNRNNGSTGYYLSDSRISRTWMPNEVKQIPFSELQSAIYEPGCEFILKNLLVIENEEALKVLNIHTEPEYFYTEKDIKKLLYEGSMDELNDFLDFAPVGAIELAKDIAVKEELPDMRKREAISKATGLNINNAINVNKIMDEEEQTAETEKSEKTRRTVPAPAEGTPARRRASVPDYKVVG